jgi:membrane-bound acyltransferase YfiQ involved in biofilm formation
MFEKKKIFVFSAARFIISEWLMTRNYPDIITYVFCKKRVVTTTTATYSASVSVSVSAFAPASAAAFASYQCLGEYWQHP